MESPVGVKRSIIIISIMLIVNAIALMSTSCNCGADKATTGDISVPIIVEDSKNIGSIDIVLTYDPSVLEITDTLTGELAQDAMMEYNADNPGRVNIGIIDTDGISGDGTLVIIGFNVVDKTGTSQLTLEAVKTNDASSLIDVINKITDGVYQAETNNLQAPVIGFTN